MSSQDDTVSQQRGSNQHTREEFNEAAVADYKVSTAQGAHAADPVTGLNICNCDARVNCSLRISKQCCFSHHLKQLHAFSGRCAPG